MKQKIQKDEQKSFYKLTKHIAGSVEGPTNLSHGSLVQTKADVWSTIKKNESKIKAFGVKKLGLFGSFVREEQSEESDVDFLVEFEQGKKNFKNFMQLAFLPEDILNRQIELVTPESLSPYIRPYIVKEVEYVTFTD